MHLAFAMLQRDRQRQAQRRFVFRVDVQAGDGQLDRVFLEAVNARKTCGRQKLAINSQVGVAAWPGPVGKLCINTFSRNHQRCQQADVFTAIVFHQLRSNALRALRHHGGIVTHAMLYAELDIKQAQKVPDFGRSAHCGLAPAARQALLNRHRRRYAVHRIDFGPACRLHDASRIGVE